MTGDENWKGVPWELLDAKSKGWYADNYRDRAEAEYAREHCWGCIVIRKLSHELVTNNNGRTARVVDYEKLIDDTQSHLAKYKRHELDELLTELNKRKKMVETRPKTDGVKRIDHTKGQFRQLMVRGILERRQRRWQ